MGLLAFIAAKRLDAHIFWIGLIGSSAYFGYLWNFFLSSVTAKLSLRKSIVFIMVISGGLLLVGSIQRTVVPYCLVTIAFLLVLGLFEVQYNVLVYHLYPQDIRSIRLSHRQFAISISTTVLTAVFGFISTQKIGHLPAFLAAGILMLFGAAIFRSLPENEEYHMEAFHPWEMVKAIFNDRRFTRLAVILTIYGWVGAGVSPILVLLYKQSGFAEWQVGILKATMTAGTIFATMVITPKIPFSGGITNYRLCFIGSLAAISLYLIVGLLDFQALFFILLLTANLIFGIAGAGFIIATQTTAINLAPPQRVTIYVNGLMVIQGVRGMLAPLAVAWVLDVWGIVTSLIITTVIALFCVLIVYIPNIDGRQVRK